MITKKIGLLLGDEDDWPAAFEALLRHYNPTINYGGKSYNFEVERIRIHPFNLRDTTSYHFVIDRLGYWHLNPREWLKKAALLNRTYLINNPFTFQSMEKHSAYCVMMRLGFNIPETWLIPTKSGPDTEKYRVTASRYHDFFDLPEIAGGIGYPLYMKPFDGGGWRDVSRINDEGELAQTYDKSGQTLMHLQAGLTDYEVFCRSLAIGPQVISLNYDPGRPMHERYIIDHDFLSAEKGREAGIIVKLINAFFGWDFNSCECILKDGVLWPIDFANACPDIAVTSLHYYFPWAITSLLAWSIYCLVTERPMRIGLDVEAYFEVADSDRTYEEKLIEYEKLADAHFETTQFEEFRATQLKDLDEAMRELAQTSQFDDIITNTVRSTFPANEHAKFIAHYRGLIKHWLDSQ